MAAGKLTPRQKMINMMYLVLTALLALNVSKEIINAFVTVNESLEVSKANIVSKNVGTYKEFEKMMQNDPKKYGDVNTKAQAVKQASDDLAKYIEGLKDTLVRLSDKVKTGEKTPDLREMGDKENYDIPTHLLCGSENNGKGSKATDLKNKIEAYKATLLKNMPPEAQADFKKQLDASLNTVDPDPKSIEYKEDNKRTWEMSKFYHNPVVASVALLTKFQGDVRNSESHIIDYLINSLDVNTVKMNVFEGKVIPNSTVVTIGNDYQADVFLSATSSTLAPDVFIGAKVDASGKCIGCEGKPLPAEGGISKYTSRPSAEGEQTWGGVIRVKKPDNTFDYYPFQEKYISQKPNSVVSADKMNVLFIGLDNPVSISVPGVPGSQVHPTIECSGCSLTPDTKAGSGHYIANVSKAASAGGATIKVTAEINGKQAPMGSFQYRVKSVPPPYATVGGNAESGNINKNLLLASSLIPKMRDFYFELFWEITEFRMSIAGKGVEYQEFTGKGNQLDEKMKAVIAKGRPGTKVFFDVIKGRMVKTKDQTIYSIPPMTFVLQ